MRASRIRLAAAVAVLAGAGAAAWAVASGDDGPSRAASAQGCDARVSRGPIPTWARGGFTDPEPRMAHAVSRDGKLAALLFGDPLSAPPAADHGNKILWVPRVPPKSASDLEISARRYVGDRPAGRAVSRVVARGPGPSIIDLPAPGCWRLTLRWSHQVDTIDLRYAAGPGA